MDNQILAWTLHCLRAFSFADPMVQRQVRQGYRLISGLVEPQPVRAADCLRRPYHRLNQDYQPLHNLCRFFLEHRGPLLGVGEHPFMPLAAHLPNLLEEFVAHWLAKHLPPGLYLEAQHRAPLEGSQGLAFHIDLVLRAGQRGQVLAVLDTKYKGDDEAASEDLQQVVAYAVRLGTPNAFLVYPSIATRLRRIRVGKVQVQTLAFALQGDLESAGKEALDILLARINSA
jgi:5-methylcytosine-specific restriction enzyme subunit McrC